MELGPGKVAAATSSTRRVAGLSPPYDASKHAVVAMSETASTSAPTS